jgi:hypothetical protein
MLGLVQCLAQVGALERVPSLQVISAGPSIEYPVRHTTAYLDPEFIDASAGVIVA